ncbi:hypothetical protein SAMN05216359_105285 [Roseateles sp. YR242]|uniref:hypothetical protein n=1 Tax=Roseateles sp. YR242 TaxID=1855305 RepID=UPI0008ACAEEF|nr:hypothetical protein [Roseateles sp. YR242]SEL12515.1 hypothetical protein SAMN05216359_105285 [Roseateles sp. YR242]
MKNGRAQCKDIPDRPILEFLTDLGSFTSHDGRVVRWRSAIHFNLSRDDSCHAPSVRDAMPPDLPQRLVLAKMNMLIRRGLVDGCACGCRGDFQITERGRAMLTNQAAG